MSTTPTHWLRLRLPGLGRDLCFVFYPGSITPIPGSDEKIVILPRAEVWWRLRAEHGDKRPFDKSPGSPRWQRYEIILAGQSSRNGGWEFGLKDDGAFWFEGSRARGGAHAQHAEELQCGPGLPTCIAEVWA